ncbi:MAG: phenylalanine--tRNA ligase subunit beta [Solirubrobacteraceae bacterium]
MLVPVSWLREYCDPALDTEQLSERLTATGTKTERVFRWGPPSPDHYVVGRVLSAEQHPNADRLKLCTVDLGEAEASTIVCGAPNVAAGQTVAVARPGAQLPDGRTLGAAKLRGILSNGMILAEDELALGQDHDGIMVLPEGLAPGTPLGQVLPLGDDVIEFEITPNRPDCLSIYGVAREAHAASGAPLAPPPWAEDPGSGDGDPAGVQVTVDCPDLCPRFTARVFEDVVIGPSPIWLRARLLAAGMRPIANVVDITNYVMLLTGQPLHAFDLDQVAGSRLTIRRARAGESIETLDGQTRELDTDMVLIEDADGPTSIAAIMGGARSEVSAATTRVLLEAANWDGANIQRSALRLGLRSEASARFEKGLSPGQTDEAMAVATGLLLELCGARVLPGTIDVGGPGPAPGAIELRPAQVSALLGSDITPARCREILEALEFAVSGDEDTLTVTPPHFRARDVTRPVDLIEEVARIDGLDRLPATLPPRNGASGRLTHAQHLRRNVEDALAARGLNEIAGWSFADPALLDRLRLPEGDPMRNVVTIENPLSAAQSIMRPTLLSSLLEGARLNRARGAGAVRIFESGTVYRAAASLADEHHAIGVLVVGDSRPSWRSTEPASSDFFAVKALLEAVMTVAGVEFALEREERPFLHPGRAALINASGTRLGLIGELHPAVAESWELPQSAVWLLNFDVLAQLAPQATHYVQFGSLPALRQDLAVVVDANVAAGDVIATVRAAAGPELESVELFDVFSGEQVGADRVSLALHLEFRAPDRTLTDAEVEPQRAAIAKALADKLGGELRA